jgi:DNA polymerase-3 subunit alpha/error-prone DNA polymerase
LKVYHFQKKNQGDLFAFDASSVYGAVTKTVIAPAALVVKKNENDLWEEYNALGFLRKVHSLALWKDDVLAVKIRVKALHIHKYIGQNIKMAGWQVTQKEVWTKDGLTMSFLGLEDETALYETVIFPDVYERYSKLLFEQQPLIIYGRVMNDEEAVSLEVGRIEVLGRRSAGESFALRFDV